MTQHCWIPILFVGDPPRPITPPRGQERKTLWFCNRCRATIWAVRKPTSRFLKARSKYGRDCKEQVVAEVMDS